MGWQSRRALHGRDAVLHRILHLLQGARLKLAHALARDAKFSGQLRERDRTLGEPTRLENATLAVVEHGERRRERLAGRWLSLHADTTQLAAGIGLSVAD
jgi:hypothetical protein